MSRVGQGVFVFTNAQEGSGDAAHSLAHPHFIPEAGLNCFVRDTRRFQASDPLQAVFDFADAQEDNAAAAYSLASNFPRRVFSAGEHGAATLSELGLAPQALLFVQPADDD